MKPTTQPADARHTRAQPPETLVGLRKSEPKHVAAGIPATYFSDKIGRKATFATYFVLGALLYAAVPRVGATQSVVLFVAVFCILISMYGGGFSTAPAYMRDLFGTTQVGAIYGRLLTAWSVAGIVAPLLMNVMRQFQLAQGIAPSQAYNQSMYALTGLLVLGFIANLLVRPVARGHFQAAPVNARSTRQTATPRTT